jgi:hypothetical protein
MWLGFGFAVWLLLAVLAVMFSRRYAQPGAGASESGWRPSMRTTRGLALAALYISVVLVPLGVGAMFGWNAMGDDRFGIFMAMTLIADLLTVLLVVAYVRVLVLLRRGEPSPRRLLVAAFASTFAGQAVALAVLLALGLPHAPTFFQ